MIGVLGRAIAYADYPRATRRRAGERVFVYGLPMPTYQLAFRDPPDNLAERLKPVLVSQGDPPVFVRPAEGGVRFDGPGAEFLLRSAPAPGIDGRVAWLAGPG